MITTNEAKLLINIANEKIATLEIEAAKFLIEEERHHQAKYELIDEIKQAVKILNKYVEQTI